MSTEQGEPSGEPKSGSKGDPTAVILYRAPTTAPIPTFFATEPPIIEMSASEAPRLAPGSNSAATEPPATPHQRADAAAHAATERGAAAPSAKPPSAATDTARSGRFVLLAACVALAACSGAIAGSLGYAQLVHAPASKTATVHGDSTAAVHADSNEDMHALKETTAQLRANVKTLSDNIAAIRASTAASNAGVTVQLTKIAETLDRLERGERRAAAAAPAAPAAPETTGSIGAEAKPAAKPAIVEGWVVRKIYDGAALIEGRYGMVEVEPGMVLPGLGRIHDIKRQDGHWVVVTAKGLIMPLHP
jgi:hypothetical protein